MNAEETIMAPAEEPARWRLGVAKYTTQIMHDDSCIVIDTDGWTRQPELDDEPDANADVVKAAIEKWIVARLGMPAPVVAGARDAGELAEAMGGVPCSK